MKFDLGKKRDICSFCHNGFLTEDTRICNTCQKHNPRPKDDGTVIIVKIEIKKRWYK